MTRPLIVLDRDGVINRESDAFVKSAEEWQALPGSLDAIAKLHHAGWVIAIATNQSGLARGKFGLAELTAMHSKLQRALADRGARIDGIFFCPHGPDDGCHCRKPRSGLYDEITRYFNRRIDGAISVGDSRRDLQAAEHAGATPVLVRTGNGAATEKTLGTLAHVAVYDDLAAAVDALVG